MTPRGSRAASPFPGRAPRSPPAPRTAPRAPRSPRRSSGLSTAFSGSSRWRALVAPMIGAVTAGFDSSQAIATWAGVSPRAAATFSSASSTAWSAGRLIAGVRAHGRLRARGAGLAVAGQHAAGQRAPGDQADALLQAERVHLPLLLAIEQVVVVLHHREPRAAASGRPGAGTWRTGRRTSSSRRCRAPCRTSRRRPAPRSSPRSASHSRTGGSGRGRRSPSAGGVRLASIDCMMCLRERPPRLGPRPIGIEHLGGDDGLVAAHLQLLQRRARGSPRSGRANRRRRCRRS